jgi:hypothetical protein
MGRRRSAEPRPAPAPGRARPGIGALARVETQRGLLPASGRPVRGRHRFHRDLSRPFRVNADRGATVVWRAASSPTLDTRIRPLSGQAGGRTTLPSRPRSPASRNDSPDVSRLLATAEPAPRPVGQPSPVCSRVRMYRVTPEDTELNPRAPRIDPSARDAESVTAPRRLCDSSADPVLTPSPDGSERARQGVQSAQKPGGQGPLIRREYVRRRGRLSSVRSRRTPCMWPACRRDSVATHLTHTMRTPRGGCRGSSKRLGGGGRRPRRGGSPADVQQ